ncbi:hypothetical protein [Corynebacterium glyciniphilum]|uniref:hypothetical protein n=1 Tax=Corynebacterium glyciniphilum TaxID=1404244 RepID=UPI003FD2B55C
MDTDQNTDHHGNGDHRPIEHAPGGMRRLTTDEGLDADGYPVMPSPHDRRPRRS